MTYCRHSCENLQIALISPLEWMKAAPMDLFISQFAFSNLNLMILENCHAWKHEKVRKEISKQFVFIYTNYLRVKKCHIHHMCVKIAPFVCSLHNKSSPVETRRIKLITSYTIYSYARIQKNSVRFLHFRYLSLLDVFQLIQNLINLISSFPSVYVCNVQSGSWRKIIFI